MRGIQEMRRDLSSLLHRFPQNNSYDKESKKGQACLNHEEITRQEVWRVSFLKMLRGSTQLCETNIELCEQREYNGEKKLRIRA